MTKPACHSPPPRVIEWPRRLMSVCCRVRLQITGVVQGVGFRPAVARLARDHGVGGFVYNDAGAVYCELEGPQDAVDVVVEALQADPPPLARIDSISVHPVAPLGERTFDIVESSTGDAGERTLIPPDSAICADCLREVRDPADRRFGHAFITCTNCGPRYTVITDLPYDRPATTMARFPMCERCAAEYHDPVDRRYHAQTIACPDCGPRLSWNGDEHDDPIGAAAAALLAGRIVAIKGIGGFHLACVATDTTTVAELRRRKNRPAKPFAVMVADLSAARRIADISAAAAAELSSPAAPIVLVPGRDDTVRDAVAPGLRDVGVMLAYSPVHHLLFDRLGPVVLVMTSANAGGSPIVYRDEDLHWIDGLADAVLSHDRPIHVPCEDSVLTVTDDGHTVPIRRSRGFAPLPMTVRVPGRRDGGAPVILATGGDLKTTFCLLGGDGRAHLSSHLGDMADPRTQLCFTSAYAHVSQMTRRRPDLIACDAHPRYATTNWALRQDLPVWTVQHHHAHAASLLAEHDRLGSLALVVAYDGTGYGTDGTIWGGELLALGDPATFTRVGHLGVFSLPGGDGAVRQPARIALDLLHRAGIEWDPALPCVAELDANAMKILAQQIPRQFRCIPTSSMGRLFDAVSSLLGVCQTVTYEGQAAVELEHVARSGRAVPMDFGVHGGILDPLPLLGDLVAGLRARTEIADLAAGFHAAVIRATVTAVTDCAESAGVGTVGLTGGVFVNRILLDGLREELTSRGLEVLTQACLPCNDGGLALGQAAVVAAGGGIRKGEA
ncbi:carbamoyltransferase HypF [Mycolicibacterium goodii]|uniref:carbamoyltransferase HypF n=1 Tax=Mycolicibacterium goodii TaxID=134601 RepID=UPI003FD6E47B